MTVKPRMKPMEFTITCLMSRACGALSSSRPTPEIRERYPGTSGSTQGDRNEIRPAKKAAGTVASVIVVYCTCWLASSELDARERSKLQNAGADSVRMRRLAQLHRRVGRGRLRRRLQQFAEHSRRQNRIEHRARIFLAHLQAVQKRLQVRIVARRSHRCFRAMKHREISGQLLGDAAC